MTTTQITTDAFFERETQMTDKGQTTRHDRENAAMALFEAVGAGDVDEVARLLSEGTDADAWGMVDDTGGLPLQIAADVGGAEGTKMMELLLDAGADINFQGEYGDTALHRSVYADRKDGWATARLLLRRGANVGSYDDDGCNAAEAALLANNEEAVLAMLEEGLDPYTMGMVGPLIWYAAWDSPKVVAKLLEMGVPHDGGGHTDHLFGKIFPVLRAAEAVGREGFDPHSRGGACLILLIDAGASLDDTEASLNILSWHFLGEHAGAVKAFLEARSLDTPEVPVGKPSGIRKKI